MGGMWGGFEEKTKTVCRHTVKTFRQPPLPSPPVLDTHTRNYGSHRHRQNHRRHSARHFPAAAGRVFGKCIFFFGSRMGCVCSFACAGGWRPATPPTVQPISTWRQGGGRGLGGGGRLARPRFCETAPARLESLFDPLSPVVPPAFPRPPAPPPPRLPLSHPRRHIARACMSESRREAPLRSQNALFPVFRRKTAASPPTSGCPCC